ncbi:hypothetical protein DCC79_12420 [bacterium]|nr:rhodanese-like domain-containing protein [Chloroflexi bacterium CFX6]RIL08956.1 MAG: hypothetical protein DCC79_12420 [bacterium]
MVEIRVNRNVLLMLLAVVGVSGALAIGIWLGRGGSPAATTENPAAPAGVSGGQPLAVTVEAPGMAPADPTALAATMAAVAAAPPMNTPAFGELTPEQDAAIARMDVAEAVAKVGQPDVVFVDTRTDAEYQQGHIQGAVSMPAYTQDAALETLPKDKEIILYCA